MGLQIESDVLYSIYININDNIRNLFGGMYMAKVITVGIQKGGQGKTMTTGVLAYLFAQDGKKVLVVDMDSQGNCTKFLTRKPSKEFKGKSIYNAFMDRDAKKYIAPTELDGVDILPSEISLAGVTGYLYEVYKPKLKKPIAVALYEILRPISSEYDIILIDTAPSLDVFSMNALVASDYSIILSETADWAADAIPEYMETVRSVQVKMNEGLKILGILRTMKLPTADARDYKRKIAEQYGDLVFDTVIHRRATTGRLADNGFNNNKELRQGLEFYKRFYWELKKRMNGEM